MSVAADGGASSTNNDLFDLTGGNSSGEEDQHESGRGGVAVLLNTDSSNAVRSNPSNNKRRRASPTTDDVGLIVITDDDDNNQQIDRKLSATKNQEPIQIDLVDTDDDDTQYAIIREIRNSTTASASASASAPHIYKKSNHNAYKHDEIETLQVVQASPIITPMHRILEIFPDVDIKHAEKLFTQNGLNPTRIHDPLQSELHESIIQLVISHLAENPSYPKSKDRAGGGGGDGTATNTTNRTSAMAIQRSGTLLRQRKYDYMSESSFEPTKEYVVQSLAMLESDFPFLSKFGIKYFLESCHQHYAICHDRICNLVMGKGSEANIATKNKNNSNDVEIPKEEQEYRLLMKALMGRKLSVEQRTRLQVTTTRTPPSSSSPQQNQRRTTLTKPRRVCKVSPFQVQNEILQDEVEYVQSKLSEWKHEVEVRIERRKARQLSEITGSTVECNCCFGDVSMEEMISCKKEGHLFCVDCLRRHAEAKVFGDGNFGLDKETGKPFLELQCMHGEGCTSSFEPDHLQKALTAKTMEKYNEIQAAAVLEQAGLDETICKCRKCGYPAMLPPTEMIFVCPIQGCGHSQCRKCGEEPHIPLRCEEVEKRNETDGRRRVEEAITEAKIRTCPKPNCGKKFIKESGCNKMTCSCGINVCYVCRKEIPKSVGYQHFCQTPHCKHDDKSKCNGCPLYSNNEEDDERAMREAGITAAEQVREDSLISSSGSDNNNNMTDNKRKAITEGDGEVRIDIDSLLGKPAAEKVANVTHTRRQARRGPAGGQFAMMMPPPAHIMQDIHQRHQLLQLRGGERGGRPLHRNHPNQQQRQRPRHQQPWDFR